MLPALKQPTFHSNFKRREKKEGWDHNENQTNVVNSVVHHIRGENIDPPLLIRHINLHRSHFIGSQILFSVCFDNLTERHTYVKD